MLPGVVGGQVKFTGSTRNAHTAANAHEPVVFGQGLTCFSWQAVQRDKSLVQLNNDLIQSALRYRRIATVGIEDMLLLLQVLQHVGLEIGTSAHVHDFKDGGKRVMVIKGVISRDQFTQPFEQMLKPQISPNSFVEGIFVKDHVDYSGGPHATGMIARIVLLSRLLARPIDQG